MDVNKVPILGKLRENGIEIGLILVALGLFFLYKIITWMDVDFPTIISLVIALAPIWLPIFSFLVFFEYWMIYIGKLFYISNGRTTLRIKLPPEVFKSPEAMEFVLTQIHNTQSPDNLMQTYLDGKRPLPISFELVSIGGDVRFYVNVPTKKTRPAIEAHLYAQYPGIEVTEELDYTAEIPLGSDEWDIMAFHMGKKKEEEYPIKTYIDYGLDKNPKEEEKVDPMTPMLEMLGTFGPDERLWVQFICTSYRVDKFTHGQLTSGTPWEDQVQKAIDKKMMRDPVKKTGEVEYEGMPRLTQGERDMVEAMERNRGKYAFNTSIRWIYAAKKGKMNGDRINPMIRSFAQYDDINRNAIGVRWRTDFNYMFLSDPFGKRVSSLKQQELYEYKLRKYFSKEGHTDAGKIFTTEEIATLFHIPGKVVLTPNLGRIQSVRSSAPGNLPIGDIPN